MLDLDFCIYRNIQKSIVTTLEICYTLSSPFPLEIPFEIRCDFDRMKWVAAMFDIYTEILVIYLAFISSDPILQYIISMYNVKFTKFHETVGYVRGGSLDDFGLPGGSPKSGFDIPS